MPIKAGARTTASRAFRIQPLAFVTDFPLVLLVVDQSSCVGPDNKRHRVSKADSNHPGGQAKLCTTIIWYRLDLLLRDKGLAYSLGQATIDLPLEPVPIEQPAHATLLSGTWSCTVGPAAATMNYACNSSWERRGDRDSITDTTQQMTHKFRVASNQQGDVLVSSGREEAHLQQQHCKTTSFCLSWRRPYNISAALYQPLVPFHLVGHGVLHLSSPRQ